MSSTQEIAKLVAGVIEKLDMSQRQADIVRKLLSDVAQKVADDEIDIEDLIL